MKKFFALRKSKRAALVLVSLFSLTACDAVDKAKSDMKKLEEASVKLKAEAEKLSQKAKDKDGNLSAPKDLNEAMKGLESAMGDFGKAIGGTAINFRELKKELPQKAAGLERESAKGQSAGQMGLKFSSAEAVYAQDKKRVDVKLLDMAATKSLLAMASWANLEVEEESKTGYKKTYDYEGGRVMEEWNSKTKRGSLNYMTASRFVVEIKGRNVEMKALKSVLKDIDFKRLNKLAAKADAEAAKSKK